MEQLASARPAMMLAAAAVSLARFPSLPRTARGMCRLWDQAAVAAVVWVATALRSAVTSAFHRSTCLRCTAD